MAYYKQFSARNLLGCALALAATGCSVHPLPENVSRASTYDIVARIRCEVWEALQEFRGDPHAEKIIEVTTIGYDFNFDMAEGNNIKDGDDAGAKLFFSRPSFKDADKGFKLDLTARAERSRSNVRRFRAIEELQELYELRPPKIDCSGKTTYANLAYPITGATGLGEVVRTYIKLEKITDVIVKIDGEDEGITRPNGGQFQIKDKNIAFSDVLKFTTTVSAGVKPSLVLSTVAGQLRVKDASFFGTANRTDHHTVIVALASDPDLKRDPDDFEPRDAQVRGKNGKKQFRKTAPVRVASAKQSRAAEYRQDMIASGLVKDSRTINAFIQKDAGARNRVLIELQRLRDLEDEDSEAPRLLGERLLQLMRQP